MYLLSTENLTLDDRIYCLQRTIDLPAHLKMMLKRADICYLNMKDEAAESILSDIEHQCDLLGVSIFKPHTVIATAPVFMHKHPSSNQILQNAIQKYENSQNYDFSCTFV